MNATLKAILVNSFIILISISLIYGMSFFKDDEVQTQNRKKAPLFTAVDSNGVKHKLADYRGKIVVLEWKNHLCPFVVKHYKSGNMQQIQENLTKQGVVWLSIISSAKGKQGYVSGDECNEIIKQEGSKATAVLFDPDGTIGKQYAAKTTPHMFVIDVNGDIVYEGAIDSIRSADSRDIKKATNYVVSAINNLIKQKPIEPSQTAAYGCSIKYNY
tara:strand:+ start:65 stop:709 length:645 start_codon:yes stop_codon:yes gene_type:complete